MTKIAQYSEDKKKWSFGGAAPFKWMRYIVIENGKRTFTDPVKIETTTCDPAAYGFVTKAGK